jgi:alpha-beta hydrolase superfamily lysophospholipase
MLEIDFVGEDHTALKGWVYFPAHQKRSRAVLFLVHGLGVHHGDFSGLIKYLVACEYAVATFDLRGHGVSEGQRGHIHRWSDYRKDVLAFVSVVSAHVPVQPGFLLGHSLGSLVVADMVLADTSGCIQRFEQMYPLKGVILIGFPADPGPRHHPVVMFLGKSLSRLFPRYTMKLKLPASQHVSAEALKETRQADPLIHRQFSLRWAHEVRQVLESMVGNTFALSFPLLMMHGEADHMARYSGARAFFDRLQADDKQFFGYSDVHHEPHHGDNAERVMKDLQHWLEMHLDSVV